MAAQVAVSPALPPTVTLTSGGQGASFASASINQTTTETLDGSSKGLVSGVANGAQELIHTSRGNWVLRTYAPGPETFELITYDQAQAWLAKNTPPPAVPPQLI